MSELQLLTDCHDSQGPNVDLVSVLLPSHNFWSHPVGGSYHGRALGVALGDLSTESEIGWMTKSAICETPQRNK
jgi:hypothetical protein